MHSGRENSVRAMLVAAAVVRHRGVSKGGFGAFTLDGIEFAVFKQPRREPAQFGLVLDDQHGSFSKLALNVASASTIASKDFLTSAGKSSASMFCHFNSSRAISCPECRLLPTRSRIDSVLLMLFYRRSAALWPVVLGHCLTDIVEFGL